jgi:hypothetical protein
MLRQIEVAHQLLSALRTVRCAGKSQLKQIHLGDRLRCPLYLLHTDACLLRKSDFTALLEKTPKLALKLLEINAQRMADTENQTRFLMMERVETRLSAYLLSLYLLSGGAADLEIPMKMKDLSAYLGTTPETLSRKLHLLEETNLISRKGKKIHIADRDGLKQMAEG